MGDPVAVGAVTTPVEAMVELATPRVELATPREALVEDGQA
jgi:hypothetical protein